jgi:nucleotide-binding universal stress UspA family protein
VLRAERDPVVETLDGERLLFEGEGELFGHGLADRDRPLDSRRHAPSALGSGADCRAKDYRRRWMRILVALDESPKSLHAAQTAVRLFPDPAVVFLVINVANAPVVWTGGAYGDVYDMVPDSFFRDPGATANEAAVHLRAEATAAGIAHPRLIVESGDVAQRITAAADRHDVDLIVVGAHTKGFLRRLVDPSIADRVVHAAHRPVLVVAALDTDPATPQAEAQAEDDS